MNSAQLLYDHPQEGTTIARVDSYRTQNNGTLVAQLADGGQLLLGPSMDWMVHDEL